jgi:signal peptide peptidase SppA
MEMRTDLWGVLDAPWAITPSKLLEIREIYERHLRGEVADLAAIEARIGKPLRNEQQGYSVENGGVAVLPIFGVISKRLNLLTQISGGTSTQVALRDFQAAVNDPGAHSIVLLVDSPGGAVDGIEEFAAAIFAARGKKPITAVIDGIGASAAYWLASAASRVYASGNTVTVGSIGVVATHVDYSQAEAQRGIKITEVTAGRYKRIASEHAPLSEEGRVSIQDQVDAIHRVFVDAVARNRGTNPQAIADTEARIFIGRDGIRAGLVDGVVTLTELVSQLNQTYGLATSSQAAAKVAAKPVAEKSMRELLEAESARVRRQPWGQKPAAQIVAAVVNEEEKVEQITDSAELSNEARGLQQECAGFRIPLATGDAVTHVIAKRQGRLNQKQIALEAQLERARLAARGIAISTVEAVTRILQQQKQADVLI